MSLPHSSWRSWQPIHSARRRYVNMNAFRRCSLFSLFLICMALASCSINGETSTALSGNVTLAGSTALQPLATEAARLFEKRFPRVHIDVQGGGSLAGLTAVTNRTVDIGDSDVYADPAVYPDPNLTDHLVCVIPFVMIVNRDVTLSNLRKQDIIDIFSSGKITNWLQVGGPNLKIVPVVRPATSGTRATFRKYILAGRDEIGALLKTDSSQTVLETVSSTPGAIGYLAVPVVTNQVRVIPIDGQLPTRASIENGSYVFWGFEHMYTLGDTSAITAFLNFMLDPEVQQLAQKLGYIPISDMQIALRSRDPTATNHGVMDDSGRDGTT